MKKLLILLAFVPFVLQAQLIQNPYIQKGITAHFPLSEWSSQPGVALTSGSLVSGAVYKIGNYVAGDRTFNGNINSLRIYEKILTTDEIDLIYRYRD